jgi:hypothetical protein
MGAYGQFAELKLADSYFFNREYIQASKLYEDFIKEYPGSPDLPYAKLQAARSNAFSARGSGRDRTPLERALTLYDELADRYPTTHYGAVAEQERRPVVQQLAEYDLMIIDFYFKKENAEAAAARQKLYDERWSARLNASSTAGLEERSLREAFAGASSGAPVAPKPIHSADDTTDTPTPSSEFEEYSVVQRVECFKDGNPYVLIEVGQLPQGFDGSLAVEELTPKNGAITLARYKLKSEIPTYDCFGSADLRFGADGRVSLKTTSPAVATTVDNPARILITLSRQ